MDYDLALHNSRVLNDGGSVPNPIQAESYIKYLKENNLWDSCVFFGFPLGGVKKDDNQFVSKVYDLKANADCLQGTATRQPKYDNGNLLYDGGDKLMTDNLLTSNPIAMCTNAISVICWVNISTVGYQFIFDRYEVGNTATDSWYVVQRANGALGAAIMSAPGVFIKNYSTVSTIGTGWKCIGFTYSVTNGMKLYINGVNQAVVKTTDNTNIVIPVTTSPVALGQRTGNTSNPMLNGNKTALHQIYNSELTESQMLWNYNNIRPDNI